MNGNPSISDRLSLLGRRWSIKADDVTPSPSAFRLYERLLIARGIADDQVRAEWADSGIHRLHDPSMLPGTVSAAERIARAIERGEKIGVFGDYDADGQTATALLTRIVRELGGQVQPYIPHRIDEGYGLNIPALEELRRNGCTLVVTVDCGISAVEEAAWAAAQGLDLIVTDHHLPPAELPQALAIVNPRLNDDYPYPELAGCGVALKVAEALCDLVEGDRTRAHRYLDLAAVGTVADVVPLTGENRVIVSVGLKRLSAGEAVPGLIALCQAAGLTGRVKAGHLAFTLGPRLNAAGRVADPETGLSLLLAPSLAEAAPHAAALEAENARRRRVEEEVTRRALERAKQHFDPSRDVALVVGEVGWHPGVIGIVASRLVEHYFRPTIVFSIDGETAKGSGRSIPGFHLYDALTRCADLLDAFGGHAAAAGLSLPADRIPAFAERFSQVAREALSDDDLIPLLQIDASCAPDELTVKEIDALAGLEPFGVGNPTPVFLCRNLKVSRIVPFGKEGEHLRLHLERDGGAPPLEAVGFNLYPKIGARLHPQMWIDLAFSPEVNEWNGQRNPRLNIRDIRLADAEGSAAAEYMRALAEAAAAGEGLAVHEAPLARGYDGSDLDGGQLDGDQHDGGQRDEGQKDRARVRLEPGNLVDRVEIIDRRGAHASSLLAEVSTLVARGESLYYLVEPGSAMEVARHYAAATPFLKERTILWRPWDGPSGLLAQARAVLERPPWLVVAEAPSLDFADHLAQLGAELGDAALAGPLTLAVRALPLHPEALLAQIARHLETVPRVRLALVYGSAESDRLKEWAARAYPEAETLRRIYAALREAGPIDVRRGDWQRVLDLMGAPGRRRVNDAGLETAMTIFRQLGLVEVAGGRVAVRESPSKVDLTDSLRYNEGIAAKERLPQYIHDMLHVRPDEFLQRLLFYSRFP